MLLLLLLLLLFLLCVWFSLIPAVSAETLGSESLKVARLTSSLKVMWICMSVAYFRSGLPFFDMSCHEFVLSLRVEFRCASDLEDEECSVSKAPEVVVTGKTHLECVESSEGFCCASREA